MQMHVHVTLLSYRACDVTTCLKNDVTVALVLL